MHNKMPRKQIHAFLIIMFMLVALFSGIWAGKAYFSSYELASYVDTVTVKYKDASYTSEVDVKYTLTVEYKKADGTIATSKIEVGDDTFESCKIGDSIELIRTDAVRKNVVRDTYFTEESEE